MNPILKVVRQILLIASLGCIANWTCASLAQSTNEFRIVMVQGVVELQPRGATTWVRTTTNQTVSPFDHLRTGRNSRAALEAPGLSVVPIDALTEIEVLPPEKTVSGLHLLRGILSFFHRGPPDRFRVITHAATGGIQGTEFVIAVVETNGTERTTISVIDGTVNFTNEQGALKLTNGQQAEAEAGRAPMRTAGFIAKNLLQWCFYYPAVLDLNDLSFTNGEEKILSESLSNYRTGDLLAALAKYPANRIPASDAEKIYHAALLLSVGQIESAETDLNALDEKNSSEQFQRLASALRTLIAAVKREPQIPIFKPRLSTELLAASYYEQSRATPDALKTALSLAKQAVTNSPNFSFGWERVAELEFSFGRTARAFEALNRSLDLAPRNAQALALKGFLIAAQNKTREAIESFNNALAVDSALGNAWLGRGLCRIRRGDFAGGQEDLLIAAALEPQRATLRSYLGKAWSDAGDDKHAIKEFQLAKTLDPNDPTAWLYSALDNERHNRINDAIRDLEKSQELNDNRSVYRSGLLLDQDRAVRSANLARTYQEAGMSDVAFREAARAVNSDYANYSAHYFLANAYNAMRDPRLVNLRFETAESTEYLVANLLAPVGAGILSPAISQQEYSKLFERDRVGVISQTEYLSRGAWMENGAQYGTSGDTSYSLEGFYRSDNGERPNNDLEQMQISALLKQRLTSQDSVYIQASYFNDSAGDVAQRYDQRRADLTFRSKESQDGLINIGYHREWNPGSHTLLLAGYLPDRFLFSDRNFSTSFVDPTAPANPPVSVQWTENYRGMAKIFFVEAQQIVEHNAQHLSILGTRFQAGDIRTESEQFNPNFGIYFPTNFPSQNFTVNFQRWSVYGYHHWEVADHLWLIGGMTYDHLQLPEDFLYAPLSSRTETKDRFLPKAGLIWTPCADTTVRFAYTKSLGGVSLEQSYRLEPAQVAGFTQAYRDVIPETAAGGPTPGADFDTYDIAFEQKLFRTTYLGLSGEILNSADSRTLGGYVLDPNIFQGFPAGIREHLDYTEKSFAATLNQLVGRDWSFGASYRVTHSELNEKLTGVVSPVVPLSAPSQKLSSLLHQISLDANFNHPSGLFARLNASWYRQSNSGFAPAEPGDDFWQFNAWAGYRFAHRRAEISIGLLNLTDQDYHLEPLTPYNDLAHRRTLAARLLINF
jgi:tetratricopeptide (TPR) repeat protein